MKKLFFALLALIILLFIPQIVGETTYLTSYAANLLFKNNLHEVVPGKFFRAAEMTPKELTETIKKNHIKTVIDLRLAVDDSDEEQGISENDVVKNAGGKYFHLPFSSARADQKERLETLLDTFDKAETPILVHCSSGTHRSGIASAIWLIEKEGVSAEAAKEQISTRYGFFQFERDIKAYFQGKPTLDAVLRNYATATSSERQSFRNWIAKQDQLKYPEEEAKKDAENAAKRRAEREVKGSDRRK